MDNWRRDLIINLTDSGVLKSVAESIADDFVQPLLDQQKKELLEKIKLEKKPERVKFDQQQEDWNTAYNYAVDDLEALKKSLSQE
jgi:hypothetical protein